jgi:arylsulfatase A-like enzyme
MTEKRLTRREAMGAVGGFALATALGTPRALAAGKKPNILYIMTDDHAAHALSCYGSRINKTPNLDRIAREGMRFENCFVTNSLCGPSRATLLTGKYSHAHGFLRNGNRFDASQQTFPKLLQAAGYQTAVVGKWHLETDPTGFDYWNVLPGQGIYHNPVLIEMGQRKTHQGYVTDIITDLSMEFLKKRDKGKPFCLLYHHKAPHRAWQPDPKHAEMFKNQTFPEPETFNDDYGTRSRAARECEMSVAKHLTRGDLKQPIPAGLSPEQEKTWRYTRYMQDYLACVAAVDDSVGRMLDFLGKEGLADDTIVVYTSDNGFFLGDHGWFDKRFMYEESLRVPFLVRYPGAVKAGATSDRMVINPDFAPTFLDFAGLPIPSDVQGRSVRPILEGKPPGDWRTSIYYHYYEFPGAHMVQRHYGVRTQQHKLIHFYQINEWELFDLAKDPHELKNVYADPAYAEVVKQMKAELERLRKELKVPEDALPPGRGKS